MADYLRNEDNIQRIKGKETTYITESILKKEGIISNNEHFETIYLNEDEIEKFMENYLLENPDTEIETRFVNHPPVELLQNVEVKWLRPETPEIPPIIIKEVDVLSQKVGSTIKIVETVQENFNNQQIEPLIIRERPPFIIIPEQKIAYVQNITKKDIKVAESDTKVENICSDSLISLNQHKNKNWPSDYGKNYFSLQEPASLGDYEELDDEDFKFRYRSLNEEDNLRYYEEKLKKTLYDEYLIKLEKQKLEEKLTRSGVLGERMRERSESRLSQISYNRILEKDMEEKLEIEKETNVQKKSDHSSYYRNFNNIDTSTYRSIKFAKVTDEREIKRLNAILNNPNSLTLKKKSDADCIAKSLAKIADSDKHEFTRQGYGNTKEGNHSGQYVKTNYLRQQESKTSRI
jgi:hypothetical protein